MTGLRRKIILAALIGVWAGLLCGARLSWAVDLPIVFIVNQQNPVTSVNVRDVVDYYEKRKRQWPDGTPVRFIDRTPGSHEREAFLHDILKQTESDIDLFWFTQRLKAGNSIPVQVSSDALVIELVKSFRGAIGYVSPSTTLPSREVKAIPVTGLGGE